MFSRNQRQILTFYASCLHEEMNFGAKMALMCAPSVPKFIATHQQGVRAAQN
jgi:hypothetical protein